MSDRNYRMKPLPIHHIWLVRWPNRLWTPQTGVNLFNNCMYYQFGIWFSILIESLTRLSVSYSITTVVQKFSLYFAGSWMNTRHFPPPSFPPDLGCPECHHGRISTYNHTHTGRNTTYSAKVQSCNMAAQFPFCANDLPRSPFLTMPATYPSSQLITLT